MFESRMTAPEKMVELKLEERHSVENELRATISEQQKEIERMKAKNELEHRIQQPLRAWTTPRSSPPGWGMKAALPS